VNDKIERYDLDAAGKQCSEGFYAHDGRGIVLIPPTGIPAAGLRLATQAEVDAMQAFRYADAGDLTNCDPTPSDKG